MTAVELDHMILPVNDTAQAIQFYTQVPWGERMFWARDPFENPISFVDAETIFTGSRTA